jgi:hypothetical protein
MPTGFKCSGNKPKLSTDVIPITATNCAKLAACHLAMQSPSMMRSQFIAPCEECPDARMMINPGAPECSYMIHKLTGTNLSTCNPVSTMPSGKPKLSAAQIQTIYDWICEGAPNN